MSGRTPTLAFVHGAFAESASWYPVIERLASDATSPEPRSFSDVVAIANPLRSLTTDAAYVRDALRAIDGPVVLVAHSYGGMVVTEAAADSSAVVALVYVGAFAPDQGESAFELSTMFPGGTLGDALTAYPLAAGDTDLVIAKSQFHQQFAADVSAEQAALMAATQRAVTQGALWEALPTSMPAWKRIPSWFVYGEADQNIPAALQRFMAERAGAKGTQEIAGASHAISVSRPDAVAATIEEAIAATAVSAVAAS